MVDFRYGKINDNHMKILALIPARGGSKSIPRKNLRIVAGKPLVAYSIEHARQSKLIDRVIVSTDDQEIAGVASQFGAEVPFLRPSEYSEDTSTDLVVFQHALGWLNNNEDYVPDIIVHLRPTAPLRQVGTIDRAIKDFIDRKGIDSLRSVSLASQSPFKMWLINGEGLMETVMKVKEGDEPYNFPRQSLPRVYWQNGYVDVINPRTILEKGTMAGKAILPFLINEPCLEIDYEEQLVMAEKLLLGETLTGGVYDPERFPS